MSPVRGWLVFIMVVQFIVVVAFVTWVVVLSRVAGVQADADRAVLQGIACHLEVETEQALECNG